MAVLTREDFQEWQVHPGTKTLMSRIKKDVQYMQEMLVDMDELTSIKEVQGRIKASLNLLDISYEDILE